jgi:hypothetical protein
MPPCLTAWVLGGGGGGSGLLQGPSSGIFYCCTVYKGINFIFSGLKVEFCSCLSSINYFFLPN